MRPRVTAGWISGISFVVLLIALAAEKAGAGRVPDHIYMILLVVGLVFFFISRAGSGAHFNKMHRAQKCEVCGEDGFFEAELGEGRIRCCHKHNCQAEAEEKLIRMVNIGRRGGW